MHQEQAVGDLAQSEQEWLARPARAPAAPFGVPEQDADEQRAQEAPAPFEGHRRNEQQGVEDESPGRARVMHGVVNDDAHEEVGEEVQPPAVPARFQVGVEEGQGGEQRAEDQGDVPAAARRAVAQPEGERVDQRQLEVDAHEPEAGRELLVAEDGLQEKEVRQQLRQIDRGAGDFLGQPVFAVQVGEADEGHGREVRQPQAKIALQRVAAKGGWQAPVAVRHAQGHDVAADDKENLGGAGMRGQPLERRPEQRRGPGAERRVGGEVVPEDDQGGQGAQRQDQGAGLGAGFGGGGRSGVQAWRVHGQGCSFILGSCVARGVGGTTGRSGPKTVWPAKRFRRTTGWTRFRRIRSGRRGRRSG